MFEKTRHVFYYLIGSLLIALLFQLWGNSTITKAIAPIVAASFVLFPVMFLIDFITYLRGHFLSGKVEILPPLPRLTSTYDQARLSRPLSLGQ